MGERVREREKVMGKPDPQKVRSHTHRDNPSCYDLGYLLLLSMNVSWFKLRQYKRFWHPKHSLDKLCSKVNQEPGSRKLAWVSSKTFSKLQPEQEVERVDKNNKPIEQQRRDGERSHQQRGSTRRRSKSA